VSVSIDGNRGEQDVDGAATQFLDISGVTVRFGGIVALDGVSIRADAGEVVGIIGPNGAGKTTLFDVISGVRKPESVLLRSDELRAKAYERFPILHERRKLGAGLLSGGEQQMLSLAPALADPPKVLIADEPTLGLAPLAAQAVMAAIVELRDRGCAVLLVEEHAQNALNVADTIVLMELGTVVWSGRREDADVELLAGTYLGSS
jgi:ABC-type branched-subunit amino acid transport system ATPase component